MPYSSARPSNIPPDLQNNKSIENAFADTPEFAAPNNDDDTSESPNPTRCISFVRIMFSLYVELSAPHIPRQISAYSADCYTLRAYCSPINTTQDGSFICNRNSKTTQRLACI
jgi:hypothetical protein